MDEHELMEAIRALLTDARNGALNDSATDVDLLAGTDEWRTAGDGASFGLTLEGGHYVVTVTQIDKGEEG